MKRNEKLKKKNGFILYARQCHCGTSGIQLLLYSLNLFWQGTSILKSPFLYSCPPSYSRQTGISGRYFRLNHFVCVRSCCAGDGQERWAWYYFFIITSSLIIGRTQTICMRRITHLHSVNEQDRKHIRRHVCLCASLTLTPRINIKKGKKKYEHI